MNRLVKLAWPIVLTMTLLAAGWSISDQLIRWGMPTWLAYGISLMFDAGGLICALYAQRAVERGTSAGLSRLSILAFAGISALLNYHHGTLIGGRYAGIAFASTSGLVELLFELHRRDARDSEMVGRGLVAEMLPRIPAMGWIMFPVRSMKTLRAAVGVRLDTLDPIAAAEPARTPRVQAGQPVTDSVVYRLVQHALTASLAEQQRLKSAPPAAPAFEPGTPVSDLPALLRGAHPPVVYFIQNGTRVKIGTSQNLKRRIDTLCLRVEDLLLAVHGDQRVERELHQRFASQRVSTTEWFELTGELAQYLADLTGTPLPPPLPEAPPTHQAREEAQQEAPPEAPQVTPPLTAPPLPVVPPSKTAAILAASSALPAGASPADIALHLAQHGIAADTAYVRTVLARAAQQVKKQAGTDPAPAPLPATEGYL